MPRNLQPELTDFRALQTNLRAVESHLRDDHYVRRFMPGEFVLGGPSAPTHLLVPVATPRWAAIEMVDGGNSFAVASWVKPSEWMSGKLKVRYWFTSPVGSINTFHVQVIVQAARDGEVLIGTELVDSKINVAGPAVANTVVRADYIYTSVSLGSDDELFSLRMGRLGADAGDTNVNAFHLLMAEVEHIPERQSV